MVTRPRSSRDGPIEAPSRRVKLLACATVLEELQPLIPADIEYEVFDFGLHVRPEGLRGALQSAVDEAAQDHDVILLGYGLCSMAVVGLRSEACTLVVPRVDDCIAAFLGSQEEYRRRAREEPGTYYLTKGWIAVGDTLLDEHRRMAETYGEERADRMFELMLRHYRRLVYIDTGHRDQAPYREIARSIADRFGLDFVEIPGSQRLLVKLLSGPWDDEFVVAPPGTTIEYADFRTSASVAANLVLPRSRS